MRLRYGPPDPRPHHIKVNDSEWRDRRSSLSYGAQIKAGGTGDKADIAKLRQAQGTRAGMGWAGRIGVSTETGTRRMPEQKARSADRPAGSTEAASKFSIAKLIPIGILLAGLVAFFATGLNKYVSFAELAKHHTALAAWVHAHFLWAVLAYIAGYAVMIAFSLPGGAVATIFGGFLFGGMIDGIGGTALAAAIVVVGATIGATALFLAARTGLGEPLRARAGPGLKRMEAGFRENAMSYLLVLRLVPLFPFWLVNLVPAFLGVPLRTYVIGTFFGIMPGTFVYASVGRGLGAILAEGKKPDLGIIFKAEILIPLLGLALLALIPVVYKRLKARRSPPTGEAP